MKKENTTQQTGGEASAPRNCSAFDLAGMLRAVGLALNASHGCVATDDPDKVPDDMSWRIDNSKEIKMLGHLESALVSASDVGVVVSPLGRSVEQAVKDGFRNTAEGVVAAPFEADDHSSGGGVVTDSGDCGGTNGGHVHNF